MQSKENSVWVAQDSCTSGNESMVAYAFYWSPICADKILFKQSCHFAVWILDSSWWI